MFRKYKCITKNDKKFLYIPLTNKLLEINPVVEKILSTQTYPELISKIENEKIDVQEFINNLHQLYLFEEDEKKICNMSDIELSGKLSCLILSVAQECNLRCSYCFADGGEYANRGKMSYETAHQAIDLLQRNSTEEVLYVIFFGGEPLLNFSLIQQTVHYCEQLQQTGEKRYLFSITTNGTLITEEIAKYLKEHNIHIHISIDGDKKTNDANRYYSNKGGSYDEIIKGVHKIEDFGMTSARGTLTNVETNINKTITHLLDIGFPTVYISPAYNMIDTKKINEVIHSYDQLYDTFEHALKSQNYKKCRGIQNIYKILKFIHSAQVRRGFCGAGINEIAVDINGDLYPCHRFIGMQEFYMGNVADTDKELYDRMRSFFNKTSRPMEECKNCIARGICGGGCLNENYLMCKNIKTALKESCDIMQYNVEKALNLYIGLSSKEKEALFAN